MASDDLLKRLDNSRRGLCTENPADYMATGLTVADAMQAAARIRELKTALKECDCINEDQAARIRELEAELDALKSDLSGYMSAANTYVNELHGVHAGTHVIVPVEPTEAMLDAGRMLCDSLTEPWDVWSAMLRAAQPGAE